MMNNITSINHILRAFALGLLVMSLAASCSTESKVVEDDVVNTKSFAWVPGNQETWENTSVDFGRIILDTTVSEFIRIYKTVDTTFEEWTKRSQNGYWGRTVAVQFNLDPVSWFVYGYYPTVRGETWNRVDSMVNTNENGDSLAVYFMRIKTETADTIITTPAGAFRCAKYVHEWFTSDNTPITGFPYEYHWYAPRVGLVQSETWQVPFGTDVSEQMRMRRIIKITR